MAEIKIYGTLVNDTNEAIVKSTQVAAVKQDGTAATQSAVNADLYAKYAAGFISSTDKDKLDGIEAGAQVNRLEWFTIDGSDSYISFNEKSADISMENGFMPTNIIYSHDKFYLSNKSKDKMYETSIQMVSDTFPGFMSVDQKIKLNDIARGAQVNVLESVKVNGTALSVSGKSVNIDLSSYAKSADTIHVADVAATATDMNLKLRKAAGATPICNVTFNAATTSAAGLMSAADKQRLDDAASAKNLEATNLVIKSLGARITALEAALTLK